MTCWITAAMYCTDHKTSIWRHSGRGGIFLCNFPLIEKRTPFPISNTLHPRAKVVTKKNDPHMESTLDSAIRDVVLEVWLRIITFRRRRDFGCGWHSKRQLSVNQPLRRMPLFGQVYGRRPRRLAHHRLGTADPRFTVENLMACSCVFTRLQ